MFGRKRKVAGATLTVRAITRDGIAEALERITTAFDDEGAEDAARALLYAGVGLGAAAMADEVTLGPTSEEGLSRMRRDADTIARVVMVSRGVAL